MFIRYVRLRHEFVDNFFKGMVFHKFLNYVSNAK